MQRSFPLRGRVVLNAVVLKDRASDFEFSVRFAIEPSCIPSTIKRMHCGLADRAKEGPGQRSILNQLFGGHQYIERYVKAAGGKVVAMYGTMVDGPGAMAILDVDPGVGQQ